MDIGFKDGAFHPRIILTKSKEQLRYTALSYCWGGDQPLKTLKSNICIAYPWSRCSFRAPPENTLQYTIIVTYKLKIGYI
ncbi:hypothetical protein K469DRAFT_371003 [Zopfia rhizophila CBS 207.26]|uniref:Heterokaryon incompatibility domain-containing protein n=1 Tax=Zopfia rhizophila CBS 207.26 TaxID=1314779 RepID=A0A6A6ENB3_9PEZI|nr:hypothetical protein K469DRAFT_371003 [Zopfia rhizophila CBS 207.26]